MVVIAVDFFSFRLSFFCSFLFDCRFERGFFFSFFAFTYWYSNQSCRPAAFVRFGSESDAEAECRTRINPRKEIKRKRHRMKPRGQETVLLLLLLLVLPPPLFLPLLPSHRPWKRWPRQQLINYSPTWQYVGRKQLPLPTRHGCWGRFPALQIIVKWSLQITGAPGQTAAAGPPPAEGLSIRIQLKRETSPPVTDATVVHRPVVDNELSRRRHLGFQRGPRRRPIKWPPLRLGHQQRQQPLARITSRRVALPPIATMTTGVTREREREVRRFHNAHRLEWAETAGKT